MSKMMKRGIFMFLLLLAVSIGIIYYTIDLDALKAISCSCFSSRYVF